MDTLERRKRVMENHDDVLNSILDEMTTAEPRPVTVAHSTHQRKVKRRKNNNKKKTKRKKQTKKKRRRSETQLQRSDQEIHPSIQYRISQLWRAYIIPWLYY